MSGSGPVRSSGLGEERLTAAEEAVVAAAEQLSLPRALETYWSVVDGLLVEAMTSRPAPVCAPGCGLCCHQPLAVSLVEAGALYFWHGRREGYESLRQRVDAEVAALATWRREGASTPRELAMQQFVEQRPCLFLDADGRCAVHAFRPVQCRNAFSSERCSYSNLPTYGFGDLAALGARLRSRLDEAFRVSALAGRGTTAAPWVAFLPEALVWLDDAASREDLRALYLPERRESIEQGPVRGALGLPGKRTRRPPR